jgi:hypothetical protein
MRPGRVRLDENEVLDLNCHNRVGVPSYLNLTVGAPIIIIKIHYAVSNDEISHSFQYDELSLYILT